MTLAQSTPDKQHLWEIVKMSDGRRVKRCELCWSAYEFGHDMPCPSPKALTPKQRELARHALGLPNKMRMSYRNRFVAGVGHDDYADWVQMVADGNAGTRDGGTLPYAGDSLFWLTESGARQALNPREKLDPEDFTPHNQGRLKNRLSDGPPLPRRYQ